MRSICPNLLDNRADSSILKIEYHVFMHFLFAAPHSLPGSVFPSVPSPLFLRPGTVTPAAVRRAGVGPTGDRPPGNGTESRRVRVGWTGDRAAGDGLLGNERPKMTFCRKMSRPEMTVGRETAAVRAQSDRRSSGRERSNRRRSAGRWIARPLSVQMQ